MADNKSVILASIYMLILTVLLFWIPVIGPFVAGFVGGRKAGSTGGALAAAVLPAILAGVLMYLLVNAFPGIAPWLAALVAGAFTVWLLVQAALVIIGALAGGATAHGGERRIAVVR